MTDRSKNSQIPRVRIFEAEDALVRAAADTASKPVGEWVHDTVLREAAIATELESGWDAVLACYNGEQPPWLPLAGADSAFMLLELPPVEWEPIDSAAKAAGMNVRDWCHKILGEAARQARAQVG